MGVTYRRGQEFVGDRSAPVRRGRRWRRRGRPTLRGGDAPPTALPLNHDEKVGGALALTRVVRTRRLARGHGTRDPRLLRQLAGPLVKALHRRQGTGRLRMEVQEILHPRHERWAHLENAPLTPWSRIGRSPQHRVARVRGSLCPAQSRYRRPSRPRLLMGHRHRSSAEMGKAWLRRSS